MTQHSAWLAGLLLVCLCASATAQATLVRNATYSLKSSSIIQGGGVPSVDLTASQTIGFFKFEFTEPLYFKLDGQCLPKDASCTANTVQRCCLKCREVNGVMKFDPLFPNQPLNCYCAQTLYSVCIDLTGIWSQFDDSARRAGGYSSSTHHGGGTIIDGGFNTSRPLNRDEIHYYEFSAINPCDNLLLTVMTLSGDQNLYVNTNSYPSVQGGVVSATDAGNQHHHHGESDPFAGVVSNSTTQTGITGNISASSIAPGYDWYSNAWSTRRMSDSLVFCAKNSIPSTMTYGMDPSTYKINMQNEAGVFSQRYYIAVHGYLPGSYALKFEAAPATQSQFFLSTVAYYHLTPALRHLHCGPNQFAVYGLPPSNDPGFTYFAIQSGEQVLNATTMDQDLREDIFAFALDVSLTINGVTTVLFNEQLDTCKMNFSHGRVWYDANNNQIANTEEPFLLEAPGCDYNDLSLAYTGLLNMIENVSQAMSLDEISQGIMGGAMWSTSDAWLGCEAYVKNNLMLEYPVDNTVAGTTRCYALPGTPEYAIDPCCNATLLYTQCCLPRTIPIRTPRLIPLLDLVEADCRNDECSVQAATEYAQISNTLQDSRIGCDAVADSVSRDPGFKDTQISECLARYIAPCRSDADCPLDSRCSALTEVCEYPSSDSVIARCAIAGLSPELKIPLAVSLGIAPSSTDAELANTLFTRFSVTSGCDQPLQKLLASPSRDYLADYNTTICNQGGGYCNWDADPTDNRVNVSCVGTPWRTTSYCYNPAKCNQLIPDSCPEISVFAGCFTNLTTAAECALNGGVYDVNELGGIYVCWLNGTDAASCRNDTLCDPGDSVCQPFCYVAGEIEINCDCTVYASSGTYYEICNDTANALTWNPTTGLCVISSEVYNGTSAGCASVVGTWYRGAFWQDAHLADESSCEADGICTGAASDEATCNNATACSVECLGCTEAQCLETGACSDSMILSTGSCVVEPVADTFGRPSCMPVADMSFTLQPIGCVDTSRANSSACSAAGGVFTHRQTNATDCANVRRCRELRNGAFIWTSKNESSCTLCGGTYSSIFSWSTGVPSPAVWTPNIWGTRSRLHANVMGSLWNTSAAQEAITAIFLARYAQLAKTYLACQYGSVASYLSLLSCACAGDQSRCFRTFQPVLLGVTRICSTTNTSVFFAPAEIHSTPATIFESGCANIELSLIPAGRFRRGSANIYSSLFLDSIQTNEWAVIENKNEIVVGQLIGNGVAFAMDTVASPGIELCLETRSDIVVPSIYTTFDFAILSADFEDFNAMYATNATVRANSAGVLSVCMLVRESGNYFPIKRFEKARNAEFEDTLTREQKAAFYAGVAIYVICWLIASYRLASLFLWTLIRPTDSSGQVRVTHPLIVPRIAMTLLFFFFFLRWLYFVLVPTGVMIKAPLIIDILMAELPTYFFITIFSLLVLWWVELYHRTSARKNFLGGMKWVFVGVNAVLYLFLVVVIIIYAVAEEKKGVGVCSTAARSTETADTVAKVYKAFVSAIAFILAAGFLLYGFRLFLMVVGVSGSLDRIIKFVMISVICSLGLLLQCALLLYSTFKPSDRKTDTALAISFTLVVEVLPGLVLIAFMRQPELAGLSWYQDIVWCFYRDRDVAVSGAGASKSFQSSKRSATSGASVNSGGGGGASGAGSGGSSGSDLAVGPSTSAHSRY